MVEITDVQKLELKPGDILVLKMADKIPLNFRKELKSYLSAILPKDIKVVILDPGMEFQIITPSKDDG